MRILFLTQIVPFPPDAGPKVKTWHVLRYLAEKGHHVTLATFVRPEEKEHVTALQKVCGEVHTIPMHRSRIKDIYYLIRSQLSGRPFLIERDDSSEMRSLVLRLVEEKGYDAIHADQLTMTQFALSPSNQDNSVTKHRKKSIINDTSGIQRKADPLLIFDAHNAVWRIVEEMISSNPLPLRPFVSLEAKRIKRYEGQVIRRFDRTLAVSDIDRSDLHKAVKFSSDGKTDHPIIEVIPIAVDTQALYPLDTQSGSQNILTLGTLHYPPNADGIRWFLQDVYPLVRAEIDEVTLTIVGKNPPTDFFDYEKRNPNNVQVTGYVPDLDPYFQQAAIAVIPVRAGSGMRVRILEALARGMPLVTTSIGIEGIDAYHNKEVLIADTAHDYAEAVIRLLKDKTLQARLSANGRKLACEQYDWQVALRKMDRIYKNETE